jgi:hypothetical protein
MDIGKRYRWMKEHKITEKKIRMDGREKPKEDAMTSMLQWGDSLRGRLVAFVSD